MRRIVLGVEPEHKPVIRFCKAFTEPGLLGTWEYFSVLIFGSFDQQLAFFLQPILLAKIINSSGNQ
jgi:hypothetical protein